MEKKKSYCIYKHISPNGLVYIGQTCQNPIYRWRRGHEYKGNPHFTRAIMKYGWDSFIHEILFNNLNKELADKLEIAYISYFKNLGISYNITDGGEINNGFSGHRHSEETKNKISNSIKAKYSDPIFLEKVKKTNLVRGKRVLQLDLTGAVIAEWESLRKAAEYIGTSHSNIRNVCIGHKQTCKGFKWKFK